MSDGHDSPDTVTEVPADPANVTGDPAHRTVQAGDYLLELVPVPVTDVDRAKAFYAGGLGFHVDLDITPADGVRIVQLTPAGSTCSIVLSTGLPQLGTSPGVLRGLHLVVKDMTAARAELLDRGVEVDEVTDVGGGVLMAGFADPDGNTWTLQHMPWR